MKAQTLREKFLDFFKKKDHQIIPSAPLVPIDDPTSLFISAGMQPLIPYLLGEPHPSGKRLANIQKCVRTVDIDEVGDNRHLTFIEMLGNWSLGDYFKAEQLPWSFEFLTAKEWLGLDPDRLYASVFEGDRNAPRDEEAIAVWQKIFKDKGLSYKVGERIFFYPKEKNWWGPVGESGPCGPDSEIFYDTGRPHNPQFGKECQINCDCGRYIEIWNNVFMEYNQVGKGKYEKLKNQNVDTGMGFERVIAILQNKETPYETSLFAGIIRKIEEISGQAYQEEKNQRSIRIIADHFRAAAFIMSEGIVPSNKDRGYVLRRLVRRAVFKMHKLPISGSLLEAGKKIWEQIVDDYSPVYPDLKKSIDVEVVLTGEIDKFERTLSKGVKFLERHAELDGKIAFDALQTYGIPLEVAQEIAVWRGQRIKREEFEEEFKRHQELSRRGAEQKFAGGLVDQSPEAIKLHTATHLLHAALRQALGSHVQQKGSNITAERLRFDFSHPQKLNSEETKKVEDLVNQQIEANSPVEKAIMSFDEAQKQGALAFFGQKYGDRVKVYSIGRFSKEVCGGPHVTFTGELGRVKIIKSEKIGGGVSRVYATLEAAGR